MFNGIIALILGYLIGSISSAYIITRLLTGKDIRQLGGGNAGARNVSHEVSKATGAAVAISDFAKGAVAVIIAQYGIHASYYYVLGAGLAAVVGHIWPVYFKFDGGNGLATTLGVLSVTMPKELLIVLGITVVLIIFTRNPVLSVNISLLSVPILGWFLEKSPVLVIFSTVTWLVMTLHFLPVSLAAIKKAGSRDKLTYELLRKNKGNKK